MKRYLTTSLMALTLLLGISCSDFLNVEPDLQISFEEQFQTAQGVREIVSGIYRDTESIASSRIHLYPEYTAGNITFLPRSSNNVVSVPAQIENTYEFQDLALSSEYDSFYDDSYSLINQINIVLERLSSLSFFTVQELDQLQAEMLALRAYAHYQLLLHYAQSISFSPSGDHLGIVYQQATINVGVDFPERATVQESYDLIKQDLDAALALFQQAPFLENGNNISYLNPINTRALYARIALQMKDWNLAATLTNEVITQSNVTLTPQTDYLNQWQSTSALSETLLQWSAPVNSDGAVSSSIAAYYFDRYAASEDLINLYDSGDLRMQWYNSTSLPTQIGTNLENRTYYQVTKYQENSAVVGIRLTEVLLIRAEALERITPGNPTSLELLNLVRERAATTPLSNSANLLEEIFEERRRELAFESHLLYDTIRYEKDIERNAGCIAQTCDLTYPSPFFILPIPQESINNNENMVQNEGY